MAGLIRVSLALTGRFRLDYEWLLAVGDLCLAPVAEALCIDLGIAALAEQGGRLGYRCAGVATSAAWTLSRIALHTGVLSVDDVRHDHIAELLDAIRQFDERHDVNSFRGASAAARRLWAMNVRKLQLLLYHRGQISKYPTLPSKRREPPLSDRPLMQAAIDRWIGIGG